MFKQILFIFH